MRHKRAPLLKILRIVTTLIAIAILLLAMTTTTRVPLHQRVLVQGIGVDRASDGQFHVTVQAVSTSAGSTVEVYQSDGSSVYDALNNIALVSGKTPFYTHNSVIIIGRTCAIFGLNDVMDFFVRYHETRPAETMFLANGTAEEILTLQGDPQISVQGQQIQTSEYVMAGQIEQLASAGDLNPQLLEVRVLDVANTLYSSNSDVSLPVLSVEGKEITVAGCAIFQQGKLKTVLGNDATVSLKAIGDKLAGGAVTVSLDNDNTATLSFESSDCDIEASIRGGVPHFDLTLSCQMNINEIARPLQDRLSPAEFDALEAAAAEKVRTMVEDTLQTTLREQQVDVFYFSSLLLHQQTGWWKEHESQWREILPKCTYTVTASAVITGEGQEMSPQTIDPVFLS